MQIFKQIGRFTFVLSKFEWSEDDRFTSKCIDLVEEGNNSFKGDVRRIWPEALFKYLEHVFPELFMYERKGYKEAVMAQLKLMYKELQANFNQVLLPRIDYARPLFKHQINALSHLVMHKHNLLSLDMGLGKSITSATISKLLDCKRTVIICPAAVKWNWFHDMCDEWGYDPINWTILDAQKSRCQMAFMEKFVVINYDVIKKHDAHLSSRPIDHFIIDESHFLKNPATRRFLQVKALLDKFPDARITLLTGTPVTNRLDDMFAYYKVANHLLGKNKSYFMRRYIRRSNGFKGKVIGGQNIPELRVRHSNFIIRKKAEECLDLPPLIISKYWMDEAEMSKEYMDVLAKMYQNRMALEEAKENKSIRQLEGEVSGNIHSLNRILATSKVTKIIELIDKLWSEGRKAIVFAGYTAPLDILMAHYGEKCIKIDGSVNSFKRNELIEKFKNDDNCHVFLGNVKAAGVGINLVNANDVIFMNFPFTPDDLEQPYKRAHRIGQKKTVNVYFTIVKNSIDEHVYSIITSKSKDINKLVDHNRKGTVDYEGNVVNQVFNKLIDQYAKEHHLPTPTKQFQEV